MSSGQGSYRREENGQKLALHWSWRCPKLSEVFAEANTRYPFLAKAAAIWAAMPLGEEQPVMNADR